MSSIVSPRPVYIYALVDPRTDEVRYIGQSRRPRTRLRAHILRASRTSLRHCSAWLRGLLAEGLEPVLRVLEECDAQSWVEAEQRHIAFYRAQGCDLTNMTVGGEGAAGHKQRPETIDKRRRANMGFRHSPETLARMSRVQKGRVVSPEERAKISATLTGRKLPPEVGKKVGDANRGRRHTPEARAHMSEAQRGRTFSPTHRARMSESRRKRVASEQECRNHAEGMKRFWQSTPDRAERVARWVEAMRAAKAAKRVQRV